MPFVVTTWRNRIAKIEIAGLSAEQREELEAPIELEEIRKTTRAMRGNTSPGPDGLKVEFIFGQQLSVYLHEVFGACKTENSLPASWTSARIALLPKPDI